MAVALPVILMALGGAYVLTKGREKKAPGKRCDVYHADWRDRIQEAREELRTTIQGSANVAPKRVLFWNGEEADQGLIQIIWNSDGPWGRIGCEPTEYGMRDQLLAESTLGTGTIVVDIDHMLSQHPWEAWDVPDWLMVELVPENKPGATFRPAEEIVYLMTGTEHKKAKKVPRRSWMEAQVLVGDLHWTTEAFDDKFGGTVYGGVKADLSGRKFPDDQEEVWKSIKTIQGPDALILLQPDSQGNGRAISLWDTHFLDISLLFDPEDGDILFEGKDWFTAQKVHDAINDNELLATFYNAAPNDTLRPIDVLLWMVWKSAEANAHGDETVLAKDLKFLDAIGAQNIEWYEFQDENPGWANIVNRHYFTVAEIMEQEYGHVWS